MSLVVIEEGEEIVSTATARDWLRAESADDSQIEPLIPAAREAVENFTGRSLLDRTYVLRLDRFPCSRLINLEMPPLQEVESIFYVDADGAEQTLSEDSYSVDIYSTPGRIVLNDSESWPTTDDVPNAVRIQFKAGYVATEQPEVPVDPRLIAPKALIQAVKFLLDHWFANRGPTVNGVTNTQIPLTFESVYFPFKVNW